jgi:hypothetical protein
MNKRHGVRLGRSADACNAMTTIDPTPRPSEKAHVHRIAVRLNTVGQLFNSMDPSPFHEQDLDRDAEEFILSWAQEFPRHEPVSLSLHFDEPEAERTPEMIARAVRHYFGYRAKLNRRELRRLWRDGRRSLLVGLIFLIACIFVAGLLPETLTSRGWNIAREGLTIAGWVAMWRPMQIYLYDWWPLRRHGQLLEKLNRMEVQVCFDGRTAKALRPFPQDAPTAGIGTA